MGLSKGRVPDPSFWRGKRVLLTGHTGMKGSWAALWLNAMQAKVTGYALVPDTEPALFKLADAGRGIHSTIADIRDGKAIDAAVRAADPEIVIHMAAQPLVLRSLKQPVETFDTNVMGTANLLNSVRGCKSLQSILVVTSDKVYANDSRGIAFTESAPLGGKDPYAASKAATEIVAQSFAASYFDKQKIPLATARAGNIIGGGDFAENRLVPDLIRAIGSGKRLELRHPEATRPWQHVLDCVCGYLVFAEALATNSSLPRGMNFGPSANSQHVSVAKLAEALLGAMGQKPEWDHRPVPDSIETTALVLDSTLANRTLGWHDRLPGTLGMQWTADWYRAFAQQKDARALTLAQIGDYAGIEVRS